jgi:hypothetical protein
MVNLVSPALPSGGAAGMMKTAGKDVAGAAYVGLVVLGGMAIAYFARDHIKALVASRKATAAAPAAQPMALFQVA